MIVIMMVKNENELEAIQAENNHLAIDILMMVIVKNGTGGKPIKGRMKKMMMMMMMMMTKEEEEDNDVYDDDEKDGKAMKGRINFVLFSKITTLSSVGSLYLGDKD